MNIESIDTPHGKTCDPEIQWVLYGIAAKLKGALAVMAEAPGRGATDEMAAIERLVVDAMKESEQLADRLSELPLRSRGGAKSPH